MIDPLRDQKRRAANRTPRGRARHRYHNQRTREKKYKVIRDHLASHPCADCGEMDVRVLQFDHVRGEKLSTVSNVARMRHSIQALLDEIKKCEVRCANCHLIRHWEESHGA